MSEILEGLNEAQSRAVTHDKGPLLIVAGAGTGKTTVLARRYAWLMREKGLTSQNILALTFTEKAAQEMEDRVLQLLPNGTYDFWISTFHGFCQRILEERALEIGLPNRFRLLNETDAWLLMKRYLSELPLDYYRPLGNPVKFLASLLKHISRAKDEGVTAERYLEFAQSAALDGDAEFVDGERKRLQELADCYFVYRRILRQEGALDFGDLIVETLRLLRERPAVLKELRQRFKIIMVDEFQDTNWAQYELVKLLAGEEKSLTVVGDDDQAIYKFRGASLANILQFRDDFPEAATVALTENYRSHQEILDVAYNFIRRNDPHRLEVTLGDTGLIKRLCAARTGGGCVAARWYGSLEEEVEAVAQEMKRLKAEDTTATWNDFAVLVRSNDGALPFVRVLERHAIPFRFCALRGLYGKPLIVDVVSLLTLADGSPDSSVAWRVMSMPCYRLTPGEISACLQYANRKGQSLWIVLKQSALIPEIAPETLQKNAKIVADIEGLALAATRESPLRVLQRTLDASGLLAHIMQLPEQEKIEAIGWLNGFADCMKRYEAATHGPTLHGFLEELKLEIESGEEGALDADSDEGPELVKVMTVHASKGLEFRHVFVVSMVDQRFPTRERGDAIPLPEGLVNERLPEGDAHLEEERRLLYVAMTRAKETLVLTGASAYGGARKKTPSVFLSETGLKIEDASGGDKTLSLSLHAPDTDKEMAEREHFPLKRRFSFTQLAAFRTCPLQYKFSHVYRIPILGSFHKSFGQSLHLTFHDILKGHVDRGLMRQFSLFDAAPHVSVAEADGLRVTLDEALEIFEERWIDEWYPDRARHDAYKKEGREAVKRMWEIWNAQPPQVKMLEQPFEWKLGEHSLKGAIDRIDDLEGGGVAIYDYKTGEPKATEALETGDKEQLRIYQLAMEARGFSVKKLAYIYARAGTEAEVDLVRGAGCEKFREEMLERMQEILASRFPPAPSPFICRHCDFKHICEHRKI